MLNKLIKNWKTATVWAAVLWLLIFSEIFIQLLIPTIPELIDHLLHLILLLPLFTIFCAYMYFKDIKKPTLKQGLALGVYFILIGAILDFIIIINIYSPVLVLYTDWSLWVSTIEIVLFTTLTAKYIK